MNANHLTCFGDAHVQKFLKNSWFSDHKQCTQFRMYFFCEQDHVQKFRKIGHCKLSKGATYGPAPQRAALPGWGKLLKYKTLVENNQFYTITTGVQSSVSVSQDLQGSPKAAAEQLAVEKAETLFIYVAQEYYNNLVSDDCELPETSLPKHGTSSTGNWLCDVEIIAALPTEGSEDNMMDEIRRYFKFEGGRHQQPSDMVQGMVIAIFTVCWAHLFPEKCTIFLYTCSHGKRFFCYSSNECFRSHATFAQIYGHLWRWRPSQKLYYRRCGSGRDSWMWMSQNRHEKSMAKTNGWPFSPCCHCQMSMWTNWLGWGDKDLTHFEAHKQSPGLFSVNKLRL